MRRKIAAILAADVAGYSRLVAAAEEETLQRFGEYRAVFDDAVARHGGRIFNTAGDAVMCAFESAVECVRAAVTIQDALGARNAGLPQNRRLQFRIGITIGDVVERGTDLLGDGVNIAARLEGLAPPGGICVSRSVHEAVANKVAAPFRDLGPQRLKNIPTPVHAFVVERPGQAGDATFAGSRSAARRAWPWLAGAGTAAAGLALAVAVVTPDKPVAPTPAPAPASVAAPPPPAPPPVPKSLPAQAPLPPRAPERAMLPADPAAAYAMLTRQASLVAEPQTVAEHAHNARLHESRGDAAAARRSLHAAALLGQEQIDPHLRYAALLRAQDGRAGARDIYAGWMRGKPARALALTHALQFEGAERRAKIEAFARDNPDFAPAHYVLAEEYGEERAGGAHTIATRRMEAEALGAFLRAESEGRLGAFFLDHAVMAAWLDKARKRRAALEAFFESHPTTPSARFTRSATGWTVSVTTPEAPTAVSYRVGEAGEFRSTGTSQASDPRTGKPAPNLTFELPKDQRQRPCMCATTMRTAVRRAPSRSGSSPARRF
jgi:class 3 adenylate cyclase